MSLDRIDLPTGETLTVLRTGASSGGAGFEFEAVLPPGLTGPPAHRHRLESETFTVLDGELQVRVGREHRLLRPGEAVTVPPGVVHAFANPTDRPVRIRTCETPAGPLEEQFHALAAAGRLPPLRRLARINVAHDLDFVLHGVPEALQRPLWRLLAALPAPSGKDSV